MSIFCEGETECAILDDLRAHWRVSKRQVELVGSCGEPRSVVKRALKWLREDGKHGGEAWAVFDRDEHIYWFESIHRAQQVGIHLALSNPCFEIWAILLHAEQRAHLSRHEAQRRLRDLHRDYDHEKHPYLNKDLVIVALEDGKRRCAELQAIAEKDGEMWQKNPSSSVYLLIEAIRKRAPANRRFG